MPLYEKAFWVMSFFLAGVLIASAFSHGVSLLFPLLLGCLVTLGIALIGRWSLALCSLALLCGCWYYAFRAPILPTDAVLGSREFIGVVQKARLYSDHQILTIVVESPGRFVIQATTGRYPLYAYGDQLKLEGEITKSEEGDTYFLKEGVVGMMRFAHIERVATGEGSKLRRTLFAIRDRVAASFNRALPPEQATFMTGLTLGKSAAFSDTLREEMKITGTTHLVALSGTNVTIIVRGVMILLGLWFSRHKLFPLTTAAIVLFVVMTGAEASVVRAAIMAIIVLLAERTGRVHSTKTAIVAAAFLMVLATPSVLVFDIGFQLSFFALMGIVYLDPILAHLLGFERVVSRSLLAIARIVTTTLAAQLAVLPITLYYFGFASLVSVLPNALIMLLIPVTMFWGLLIFLVSLFSVYLAFLVAFPARLLLGYELGAIHFFSRFKIGIATDSLPFILVVGYYVLLIALMVIFYKRTPMITE